MHPHDRIDRLNESLEGRYPIERELGEGRMATFTELRERMSGS